MNPSPQIEHISKHLRYTALKCLEEEKLKQRVFELVHDPKFESPIEEKIIENTGTVKLITNVSKIRSYEAKN